MAATVKVFLFSHITDPSLTLHHVLLLKFSRHLFVRPLLPVFATLKRHLPAILCYPVSTARKSPTISSPLGSPDLTVDSRSSPTCSGRLNFSIISSSSKAFPNLTTGCQQKLEMGDDQKLWAFFFDKRNSQEVNSDALGGEFKGHVFKITGGRDKQGFPMKKGVLTPGRVRLLLHRRTPCFRGYGRRNGEKILRKSVRGCTVS